MQSDEQAIRDLVKTWLAASKSGDLETLLGLMTDDVVFMVPGKPPFGKAAFAAASQGRPPGQIDGTSEIEELRVLGDWAWLRNRLTVRMTPPGGQPATLSGYTLTILRKNRDGAWAIARDANLLMPEGRS